MWRRENAGVIDVGDGLADSLHRTVRLGLDDDAVGAVVVMGIVVDRQRLQRGNHLVDKSFPLLP